MARERFEASLRAKVETLGSTVVGIDYVADDDAEVRDALAARVRRGTASADVILTAGAASTDRSTRSSPRSPTLGGRVVGTACRLTRDRCCGSRGSARRPSSGFRRCGAYSKATAADLLLPRLLTGEPPTERTVSRLGHGGILTRSMRFRFPRYARELDAPDG